MHDLSKAIKVMVLIIVAVTIAPVVGSGFVFAEADNHDDPGGYCLCSDNVILHTSEIQNMSEEQIESLISENAHFSFRLYGGTWAPITTGYFVDFSSFNPTAGTYTITVRFPNIPNKTPDPFTKFSVTIISDMAPVRYEFKSGTEGVSIPSDLMSLQPSDTAKLIGSTATPEYTFKTFHSSNGTWTFEGWDASEKFVQDTSDITFTGTWSFKSDPAPLPIASAPAKTRSVPSAATTVSNIYPIKAPKVVKPKAMNTAVSTQQAANTTDNPLLKATLGGGIGITSVALATLLLSIFSDIRVIRWYLRKALENRR